MLCLRSEEEVICSEKEMETFIKTLQSRIGELCKDISDIQQQLASLKPRPPEKETKILRFKIVVKLQEKDKLSLLLNDALYSMHQIDNIFDSKERNQLSEKETSDLWFADDNSVINHKSGDGVTSLMYEEDDASNFFSSESGIEDNFSDTSSD